MVQFNLLPDVKLEYIRSKQTQHLIAFIAVLTGIIALAVLLFSMFIVYFVQRQYISSLDTSTKKLGNQLKNTDDIERMLTVQNQLSTLTALHEGKPVTSRLFGYLQQLTPQQSNINRLRLDFATNSLTIGGTAQSLDAVKVYADALKTATFKVDSGSPALAFSDVVLANFSRNDSGANFTITSKFALDLFDSTKNVTMQVTKVSADSEGPFEGNN